MVNLFEETEEKLKEIGKDWQNIEYISVRDDEYKDDAKLYKIDIDNFISFAKTFSYNNGYGGNELNLTLRIVFYDCSFLERAEYDGSEWWEYKKLEKPTELYNAPIGRILDHNYSMYGDDEKNGGEIFY